METTELRYNMDAIIGTLPDLFGKIHDIHDILLKVVLFICILIIAVAIFIYFVPKYLRIQRFLATWNNLGDILMKGLAAFEKPGDVEMKDLTFLKDPVDIEMTDLTFCKYPVDIEMRDLTVLAKYKVILLPMLIKH